MMLSLLLGGGIALLPPIDPGLPTPPPPLPTYVTNGDGSRMVCPPGMKICWPDPQYPFG